MNRRIKAVVAMAAAATIAWPTLAVPTATAVGRSAAGPTAVKPYKFKNCTAMNKKFKHGVGKKGAKDKTANKVKVSNFYVHNTWYQLNKSLDRDKDGIACEKR